MVYLNNAATSWPKPPSVLEAVSAALAGEPVSPLRSSLSKDDDLLLELRQKLGRLFNISDWQRIFFCSSATDAFNRLIDGLGISSYDYAIDSHNSVLRPLANKSQHLEASPTTLSQSSSGSAGNPARTPNPSGTLCDVLFLNHCSNVTGEICDVRHKGQDYQIVNRKSVNRKSDSQIVNRKLLVLDAAQSAGCIPIDVDGWGVDILVFTGHKGLFGPMGVGGYYVRRGIDLRPSQFGGTGRDSSVIEYGENDEWEYEVGTQNMPGLAGLKAGVDYVLQRGVENICEKEQQLTRWLIDELRGIPKVQLYVASGAGPGGGTVGHTAAAGVQGPVVSFNIKGLQPSDVGYILQNSYGITVRTGLHCAPLIHRRLGTGMYGTVRASLSDFTTLHDLQALVKAVSEISGSIVRS